jgi:perosamine synthetase
MSGLAMLGGSRAVPRDCRVPRWPVVTGLEEEALRQVMASGKFTSAASGEREVAALERDWAGVVGTRHCAAVSSGTAAISLALAALGLRPGDEVIVPALSFIASAVAPLHVLTVPVFVDVHPRTFNLDPAAIEQAITPRTRAVLVVHLHGLPADMDAILAIARRAGLRVIEDAAQAHGATYKGRQAGSIGVVNAFSLNVSKNLPTCGEGGLVTTDDAALHERVVMMRQFGEVIPDEGERTYISHLVGWNHKLGAIQAAFTRAQLSRFQEYRRLRDRNVRRLLERLAALPGLLPPEVPADREHAWHILRFRVDPAALGLDGVAAGPLRAALMRVLRAEGVPLSQYQLVPLPGQRVFQSGEGLGAGLPWTLPGARRPDYRIEAYPNAMAVVEDSFTLQKAHLGPAAGELLERCADAFEKVWEHMEVVARIARAAGYRPPWWQLDGAGGAPVPQQPPSRPVARR